ncbi:uncharacterized protein JCM15063_000933 [Sporobolomyces koalae]|uniref:uncharacterized protein n=1 Tax=Sporobolomyces koalae TaxID=500713 RepID=UPI003172C048
MLLSGSRDDNISTVEIEQEQPSKRRRLNSNPACEDIFGDDGQPDRSESDFDEEEADDVHDLFDDSQLGMGKVSHEKKARPKRNPKGYTTEGQRDYVVLDARAKAESANDERRQELARQVEKVCEKALEKAPHVGSAFQEVLKEDHVLNGLDEYLPGARFDSAQAVATADPNSSTAVSPYGMQVWQRLILALGKEEGRGAVPSGLAAAAVYLLSNLAHRGGGGAESPSGSELQEAWQLAKAEAARLVEETLPPGSDARRNAIDAIERQTIEWSGNLFDLTSHVSNYAPLASLDRTGSAAGIDADSTFTARLTKEKGSAICDTLLLNANGFATNPYSADTVSSALVRTTPVEAIDCADGTMANSKESDNGFVRVQIPLVLPGFANEHGTYREAVADLDADASEAALHALRTGRELATVERSNFAQSAIPRIPRVPHPKSARDFAISVNQLRRDEIELQASLDPARVPRGGFRCDSLPQWLRISFATKLGAPLLDDCNFIDFQNLPLEVQEVYARRASQQPGSSSAQARLDGVTPLAACASIMSLKSAETLRSQQFDDGLGGFMDGFGKRIATQRARQLDDGYGGTMNGLEASAKKGHATLRTMQLDDGQGGTMNGLEAGSRKGHATLRTMQLDDGYGGTMNGLEANARKGHATKRQQVFDDGHGATMNGSEAVARKANATKLANETIKMIHQGVKEFKCPDCSKLFGHKGNCTQHCINVHPYDKDTAGNFVIYEPTDPLEPSHEPTDQPLPAEKNFPCPHPACGRGYTRKDNLNSHIKVAHQGVKEFNMSKTVLGTL